MQQYLKGDKLQKTFQEQLFWEEKRALLLNINQDSENWKKEKGDKKYGIQVWIKKYDVQHIQLENNNFFSGVHL